MRIGIDVGGTHTDAVILNGDDVIAATKALTTSDVISGVTQALENVLQQHPGIASDIQAVMIGTTQFTNAVVERRELTETAAVRIALPSGQGLSPMVDWPEDIADAMGRHSYMLHGGFLYDGWSLADMREEELENLAADIAEKGLCCVAIASAFSPMNPEPEVRVAEFLRARVPGLNITLSHQMGSLGIMERENAAILNASLLPFADKVVDAFVGAIKAKGLTCPMFISQNDGTLMNAEFVRQFPALTFASGPTNSLRGASKLTGFDNAIVVDIGGTTSDIGFLQDGFPRTSHVVIEVGGVRTNFRMPDIQAVGLGGGSVVSDDGKTIGPYSVGHKLVEEGLVFGGETLTASDIAVAAGHASFGEANAIERLDEELVATARQTMIEMVDSNIDMMKPNADPLPVILVGGGAILIQDGLTSASELIRPENAGVANAIGAAIAQIGGEAEAMLSYREMSREQAIEQVASEARQRAVQAGADAESLTVADVEETSIPYMDDGMFRVKVKVIGDIASLSAGTEQEIKLCN